MFGIGYMKAPPTTYVMHFKAGRLLKEGPGLSLFYFAPTSTLVSVPLQSADVPFVFNEVTSDFQTVTLQGQLTFRVTEPKKLAGLMDYSVDAAGRYLSDDPEALPQRLIQATQIQTRAVVQRMTLKTALVSSDAVVREVVASLFALDAVTMLGVEILALSILSIKPTPEMSRALEADAREGLQRQADEAIYSRRNAAVEQERRIKESELNTELAVEEKRRQIRETQMNAEIAVEQQRSALIERRAENEKKDADAKSYALEASLKPLKEMDWRTLMAVAARGADPRVTIAMAFRELAENAQKIGELNVSPDLLNSLMTQKGK